MSQVQPILTTAGEREAQCMCPACSQRVALAEPVAVCMQCGTVNHRACWEKQDGCGSYQCAPARRNLAANAVALSISTDELQRAVPLPTRRYEPSALPLTGPTGMHDLRVGKRRRSGLAIAAFVVALVSILPIGLIGGFVAVILGGIALGGLRQSGRRGAAFAIIAIILGLMDVVGWLVVVVLVFLTPHHLLMEADLATEPPPIDNLDPVLKRAMCASVVLEVPHGRLMGAAAGSGVILQLANNEALLVTNRHVVDPKYTGGEDDGVTLDGLPEAKVRFIDQTEGTGKVVWLALGGIDLALVRVAGPSSKAMTALWQPHRPVRIADPVFAIGNPHRLGWTHTQGAVSQRRIQLVNGHKVPLIQTQTAINPGNSGGGLFDKEGYVIGIATWTSDKRMSEGLNFAISLDALADLHPAMLPLPDGK